MNSFILDILADPLTREPLLYEQAQQKFVGNSGVYSIVRGVPILLPPNKNADSFNYQEHYEEDAKAFDYFSQWHPVYQEENRRLHQQILKEIPAEAGIILDVGCGGAWLAAALVPQGRKVVSMDISTTNPLRATELVSSPDHSGLVADVFHLPLKKDSVDCIVASEIIEHVQDPQLFIASLFNVLKPGGRLIITTPYNEAIQYSLCIHCNQRTPHHAHIHSFTESKIRSIAPSLASVVKTRVFNNKLIINFKLHMLLRFLSFGLWSVIDGTACRLMRQKALRLMMTVEK